MTATMSRPNVKTSFVLMQSPPLEVDRPAYEEYYTIIRQGCKLKNSPSLDGWGMGVV